MIYAINYTFICHAYPEKLDVTLLCGSIPDGRKKSIFLCEALGYHTRERGRMKRIEGY